MTAIQAAHRFSDVLNRVAAGIGLPDYLIAATAALLELDLLTRNVRHFPMLSDLDPAY